MSSDSLREELARVPFQPITLCLPSGQRVIVRNPELAMFNETGRTLAVFEGERLILVDVPALAAVETTTE